MKKSLRKFVFGLALILVRCYHSNNNKGEEPKMTIIIESAVTIRRIAAGHYTVNNTAGNTITFARLKDAKSYIASNWSIALIEAQFAA